MKLLATVLCLPLSGCAVSMYGYQSSGGGTQTTVASTSVAATASSGNAQVSFRYGTPVPPTAPGGHLTLSNGSANYLAAGVIIAGFVQYIIGGPGPTPLAPGTLISHTCSCYQKPVSSE